MKTELRSGLCLASFILLTILLLIYSCAFCHCPVASPNLPWTSGHGLLACISPVKFIIPSMIAKENVLGQAVDFLFSFPILQTFFVDCSALGCPSINTILSQRFSNSWDIKKDFTSLPRDFCRYFYVTLGLFFHFLQDCTLCSCVIFAHSTSAKVATCPEFVLFVGTLQTDEHSGL